MENLDKALSKTSLFHNERQALIYLNLIKEGPLGAEKLHDKTGLHRETIQRELDKMALSGTVELKKHGRNKKAYPISITSLQEKLDRQYESFELLLKPLLEAKAGQNIPKIDIYMGNHQFALLQSKLIKLQPVGHEIKVISAQPKAWLEAMVEARRLSLFEKNRLSKEIKFELCCFSQYRGQVEYNNREYFAGQPERLKRKYRYLDTELNSPLQIQIWFSHAIISIFDSYPSIHISIENSKVILALRAYFELLWRTAK